MGNSSHIPIIEFCKSHRIKVEVVQKIHDHGLIEIHQVEEDLFLPEYEVRKLEKIVVFYHHLHINMEGIETILELLKRLENAQDRIIQLENELHRYK